MTYIKLLMTCLTRKENKLGLIEWCNKVKWLDPRLLLGFPTKVT